MGAKGNGVKDDTGACPASTSFAIIHHTSSGLHFIWEVCRFPYRYSCFCFQNYFRDGWNVFDFIVVLGSLLDFVLQRALVSWLYLVTLVSGEGWISYRL